VSKYKGMTTLDRLALAGLLHDFEAAVKAGARLKAVDLLMRVELTEAQAVAVYEGAAQLKRNLGA
jgi:hypothetical protein